VDQTFEDARNTKANRLVLQRRQSIVEEQEREIESRQDRSSMKVVFRRSDEEKRLVSLLSKQTEE
jgi:hypothetical protein